MILWRWSTSVIQPTKVAASGARMNSYEYGSSWMFLSAYIAVEDLVESTLAGTSYIPPHGKMYRRGRLSVAS